MQEIRSSAVQMMKAMKYKFTKNSATKLLSVSVTGFNSWKYFCYSLSHFIVFYLPWSTWASEGSYFINVFVVSQWVAGFPVGLSLLLFGWFGSDSCELSLASFTKIIQITLALKLRSCSFPPLYTEWAVFLGAQCSPSLRLPPFKFRAKVILRLAATDRFQPHQPDVTSILKM